MNESTHGLHEISMLLGKLVQQTETLTIQTARLSEAIEEVKENGAAQVTVLDSIKARVAVIELALEKTVLPNIADYQQLKNRGWGILTVVGLIGGSIATVWPRLVKSIFGE